MYKVVFCGDAAVGKSTLIMRLCKGKFITNLNSTLGVDFQNKQLELDEKRIAIQLWDTAGQERLKIMMKNIYFKVVFFYKIICKDFVVWQHRIFVDVTALYLYMIRPMNDRF